MVTDLQAIFSSSNITVRRRYNQTEFQTFDDLQQIIIYSSQHIYLKSTSRIRSFHESHLLNSKGRGSSGIGGWFLLGEKIRIIISEEIILKIICTLEIYNTLRKRIFRLDNSFTIDIMVLF